MRHVITEGVHPVSEIIVDAGALTASPLLPERPERATAAILTQPTVVRIAGEVEQQLKEQGIRPVTITVPDGEAAKRMGVVEDVYRELVTAGVGRGDTIVAVGGGALTDVAGFVAGTYLRGIEAVFVPTTLLGAVDAAIGGKTGVNVDGKNLAGLFRHPARIVVDLDVIAAIPSALLRDGSAESLKAGYVGDPDLVRLYERHGLAAPLDEIVNRAISVKVAVVSSDFTEQGRRAVLNYGHTVGHAVEVAAGVGHGEAIAIGMAAAGALSARLAGFTGAAAQRDLIASLGLPVKSPPVLLHRIETLMSMDKKRDDAGLRFVLLEAVGIPTVVHVDPATVRAALASVGIGEGAP
jgi:3-dehydroquinate synthase